MAKVGNILKSKITLTYVNVKNAIIFNLPVESAKTAQTINYTNFTIILMFLSATFS